MEGFSQGPAADHNFWRTAAVPQRRRRSCCLRTVRTAAVRLANGPLEEVIAGDRGYVCARQHKGDLTLATHRGLTGPLL